MLDELTAPIILVIDDQVALGQLIKRIAKRIFPAASVLAVTSGLAGLDLAEQYAESLRLVILDVHMPVVDGAHGLCRHPCDGAYCADYRLYVRHCGGAGDAGAGMCRGNHQAVPAR